MVKNGSKELINHYAYTWLALEAYDRGKTITKQEANKIWNPTARKLDGVPMNLKK